MPSAPKKKGLGEKRVWGESQSVADWETLFWVTVCMVVCLIFALTNYQCFVRTMPLMGTICGTICEDSSPLQCERAVMLKYTQIHRLGRHCSRTCLAGEQTGKTVQWPTSYRAVTLLQMLALVNRPTTTGWCIFLSLKHFHAQWVHIEYCDLQSKWSASNFSNWCPLILIFVHYFYTVQKVLVSQPFFSTQACLKKKKKQ